MNFHIKKLNSSGVAHHFVIALIAIVAIASFGAYRVFYSKAATSTTGVPVRVMQANIYYKLKWGYDSDLKRVMRQNPDFITLNEATLKNTSDLEIPRDGTFNYSKYKSIGNSNDKDLQTKQYQRDARVLWDSEKWQKVTSNRFRLSGPSNEQGGNRWANWATLCRRPGLNKACTSSSKKVTVISVHTLQSPMKSGARQQLLADSMKNLTKFIKERNKSVPVIVGGDFNLSYSGAYSTSTNKWFPKAAMQRETGSVSNYARLGKPPAWITVPREKDTIDYVFFTTNRGLTIDSHKLIEAKYSDHHFVRVNFTLK